MPVTRIIGFVLVIVGITVLLWGGIFWTRNKTVLEGEDRLLCFGKLEEMRSMIPDRKQKRVRRLMKKHLPPESA